MRGFNDIPFWWSQSSLWVLLRCPRDNQYPMNFRRLCWWQTIYSLIFRIDFFLMYCIFLSLTQKYTALLSWVLVLVTDKLWPMFLSTFKNSNMAALLCFSMPFFLFVINIDGCFLSSCLMNLYWKTWWKLSGPNHVFLQLWLYCAFKFSVSLCLSMELWLSEDNFDKVSKQLLLVILRY